MLLYFVVYVDGVEVIEFLCDCGVCVSVEVMDGFMVFYFVCARGNVVVVKVLVR